MRNWKWVRVAGVLGLFFVLLTGKPAVAQASEANETEVRALMLINLAKFVEWPGWKFEGSKTSFQFCISGSEEVSFELTSLLKDRQVQGRAATVRQLRLNEQSNECHMLYVHRPSKQNMSKYLPTLMKSSILLVGDQHLTDDGIIIGLPFDHDRIKIEVDLPAAQRSGLNVSSRLLQIAQVTK